MRAQQLPPVAVVEAPRRRTTHHGRGAVFFVSVKSSPKGTFAVQDQFGTLESEGLAELEQLGADLDPDSAVEVLEEWRLRYFGKKGRLTDLLRLVGTLPKEERPR